MTIMMVAKINMTIIIVVIIANHCLSYKLVNITYTTIIIITIIIIVIITGPRPAGPRWIAEKVQFSMGKLLMPSFAPAALGSV